MPVNVHLVAMMSGYCVGEYLLQPTWLRDKITHSEKRLEVIGYILLNSLTIACITWILLGDTSAYPIAFAVVALGCLVNFGFWEIARVGFLGHIAGNGKTQLFMLKTIAHLIGLFLIWGVLDRTGSLSLVTNQWLQKWSTGYIHFLILLSGFVVNIWAIGELLNLQMHELITSLCKDDDCFDGLPKGGRIIGQLERLLAFSLIVAGHPGSVGFIVAAKSVFRIGDLTNATERKQAEYIFIGTFRSFAYSIVVSLTTVWLIKLISI